MDEDSVEVAEAKLAVGNLRASQARLDEAEQLIREGLNTEKKHLPQTHPSVAKGMVALGEVMAQRGHYEEAIQTLEEAVRIDSLPSARDGRFGGEPLGASGRALFSGSLR